MLSPEIPRTQEYVKVQLPKFEETISAKSSIPLNLLNRLPELAHPFTYVGLPEAGKRNIIRLSEKVDTLLGGQFITVNLDELSEFRWANYERAESTRDDPELRAFYGVLRQPVPEKLQPGSFICGVIDSQVGATSIDTYTGVVDMLGIGNAPNYEDLLLRGLTQRIGSLDYKADDFETDREGVKGYFYMEKAFNDSRPDDEPEYSLSVCIYKPRMQAVILPQIAIIAALNS